MDYEHKSNNLIFNTVKSHKKLKINGRTSVNHFDLTRSYFKWADVRTDGGIRTESLWSKRSKNLYGLVRAISSKVVSIPRKLTTFQISTHYSPNLYFENMGTKSEGFVKISKEI